MQADAGVLGLLPGCFNGACRPEDYDDVLSIMARERVLTAVQVDRVDYKYIYIFMYVYIHTCTYHKSQQNAGKFATWVHFLVTQHLPLTRGKIHRAFTLCFDTAATGGGRLFLGRPQIPVDS